METRNFSVINRTDTSQYQVFGGRQKNMLFVSIEKHNMTDKNTGEITSEWYETAWVCGKYMYHMNAHIDSNIDRCEIGKRYDIDISLVEEVVKTKTGTAYSSKMRVLGVYGNFDNLPFKDKEKSK